MLVYATASDLEDPPENADALLRAASLQVRWATRGALYDVDSAGLPRDAEIRQAFRDATVAQVQTWLDLGITPATPAQSSAGRVASKSMGGRSVTYADDDAETKALRSSIASGITSGSDAYMILASSGLLGGLPWA